MPLSLLFQRRPRRTAAPRPTVEWREHAVAGRVLPLKLVRNARAKRLTLRIEAAGGGRLRVTVPPRTAAREVDRFLLRQREWLEARVAKLPDSPRLGPGARMPLRGVAHRIVHAGGRGGVTVEKGEDGPALRVGGDPAGLGRRLADFLKREARGDLDALVARHAALLGRAPTALRLRDTKSRWGSCTAAGALSFSWRIVMAPPHVIDYLAAHEVAHLREMNHGPAFWALCRTLCPRTDEAKAWLKENGAALQAIGFG